MAWNGASLVTEFATALGDTSAAFKAKTLAWINDGLKEIFTSHEWPFSRERGQVVLASGQDTHAIVPSAPSAPTVATSSGGSLTDATAYKFLITFYESSSGVESIAGTASAAATTATPNLQVDLTAIPTSTFPLVTERRVYVSKGGAVYFYHSTIANNTTTALTVGTDTTSTALAPDDSYIYKIDGDLYLQDSRTLEGYSLQRLRFETSGHTDVSGTPSIWASINQEEIAVYPKPSAATTATFYYFRMPAYVHDSVDSKIPAPSWLYECLHDYVIWRGYQYRDRSGQESKRSNYDKNIKIQISRKGGDKKRSMRVRSVIPDSDGFLP